MLSVRAGGRRQQAQRWDARRRTSSSRKFQWGGQSMRPAPARWPSVERAPLANTNNRPAAPERETRATSTFFNCFPLRLSPSSSLHTNHPTRACNGRATSSPKPCCQDDGGRDWKSGEMLFYYLEGGGKGE